MKFKIMCLDDEQEICEILSDNIAGPNREIWTFTNPTEFLKEAARIKPDLVLLDFRLPQMNGDEVAARLDPAIPKIMLSGDLDLNPVSRIDLILAKPIDFDALELAVRRYECP